jgi:hypothetical protein
MLANALERLAAVSDARGDQAGAAAIREEVGALAAQLARQGG